MPRKPRLEIEGGLYHVITRGNDRQDVFHSAEDHGKFISLLAAQKLKAPFFLYAFCLMTNHIHLLIERQKHAVGQVMQRVLTGYSQWYNRKYKHVGHVFQGRHKSILCDGDNYLTELVRYIHLNPVRAKMVDRPEDYPYSSHREYLGLVPAEITDVDPVLRRLGHTRELALTRYREFIDSGIDLSYPEGYDSPVEVAEFADHEIHRMGEVTPLERKEPNAFEAGRTIAAITSVFGMSKDDFCGPTKNAASVMAKHLLILAARDAGASVNQVAQLVSIDPSNVSRHYDEARRALASDSKLRYAKKLVDRQCEESTTKSQA